MRKILLFVFFMIMSVQINAQLVSIGDGTTFSSQYVYYYPSGWWTGIYNQSEINTSGDIYSLTVQPDLVTKSYYSFNNQSIYIGHTSDVEFTSNNVPDKTTMTLVYSGYLRFYDLQDLTIEFNSPFTYNNTDNLIIYWENATGGYSESVRFPATESTNQYLASYAYTYEDTAKVFGSNRPDIKLNFAKQYDVRPQSVITPMTDGDLNDSELVRIFIENMGFDPVSNFTVKYSLDEGVTWVSDTYTGTISPFTTATFNFSTTADFSAEKDYQLMVVTELDGDEVTSNDTIVEDITHLVKGAKCSDPIVLTDPVKDLEGNTFETGNHYHYNGSVYCASNYVAENDAVYSFTLAEDTEIRLRVDADRNVRVGLHLLDGCPESSPNCLQWSGGTLPSGILEKKLTAGTYYVIVSSFSSISDYYFFWMDWDWNQDTDIDTFKVDSYISSEIDKVNHTIDLLVPNGTDVTSLTPEFALFGSSTLYIGADLQTSAVSSVDFTSPVVYTVKSAGEVYTQDWTVTVTVDTNTEPTDITLDNNEVDENQPANIVIGNFATVDDTQGTYEYSLVIGTGDTDNGMFLIEGDILKAAASFDYETQSSYQIRVQSTENGAYTVQKEFEILVNDTNESPVGLSLSNTTTSELSTVGTVVGILSTTDPEGTGSYTYSMVDGAGSTHNSYFYIDADSVKIGTTLDYETAPAMYIRVATTDEGGLAYETNFTITITAGNEAPTEITLSNNTLYENNPANALIGTLSSSDPEGGSFIYEIVTGEGDTDNAYFSLLSNYLVAKEPLDAELKDSYSVRIQSTDNTGLSFSKSFSIIALNVNEAPDSIYLSSYEIEENLPLYTEVAEVFARDVDNTEGFMFDLASGEGDDDNSKFLLYNGILKTNKVFDYETTPTLSLLFRVYDAGFKSYFQNIIINVKDVEEQSTDIHSEEFINSKVYPSVADNKITLYLENETVGSYEVMIYDLKGQVFVKKQILKDGGALTESFMIQQLPAGVYFMGVESENQLSHVFKFIKK